MKMERPKSTILPVCSDFFKRGPKKRSKSWEPIHGENCSEIPRSQVKFENRKNKTSTEMRPFDLKEICYCEKARCSCIKALNLKSRSVSACDCHILEDELKNLRTFSRCSSPLLRKQSPPFYKAGFEKREGCYSETDLRKIKRSLRLLGLELSDFGIYSDGMETNIRWKPNFHVKVSDRSFSLESLRGYSRNGWTDNRLVLDESHRRLLAQAAYEKWYIRKEKELWEKRKDERERKLKDKERLGEDIQRKKEKSKKEFQKWLRRKRNNSSKEKKIFTAKKQDKPFGILVKSREEVEEAFLKWKKTKDKDLRKKRIEKRKEEEKRNALEMQKAEKKATAEKAFLQWRTRLEINEKLQKEKRRRMEEKQMKIIKKNEKRSPISFQIWKEAKDQQIKQKTKQMSFSREAHRGNREKMLADMEERMYEAEQAFEDWLEKLDSRRQKMFCSLDPYQKNAPWIPV